MKKIKSIHQLQFEKKRIKQEAAALENKIRSNWHELRDTIKPVTIVQGVMSKLIKDKTAEAINGESILKNTFTYGISLLAKKFADKTEEKLEKIFKK
ncbi:MAG: hypothetical protein ACKVOW_20295 [Chitinophagaceae bacterium]